jgi:Ni/Fe-hydrogenase subunit HybB-like protein
VNSAYNPRVVTTKTILWLLVGVATAVALARFAFGLGRTTALTDVTPWGMWIGFDVLAGVALAAGGFVIAATVHIFRLEKYHALVRPAILTAFLGYLAVIFGLLMDLGRPWNIWRMMIHWQTDSPLFEVGWCVMLYTTVLALEFAPVVFEKLRFETPLRWLRRATLVLVVAGIGLSTLHQSSLGTLFLLTPDRMHPLWYSPILPLMFFVTAVALGLAMVTTESLATSWLYRREPEWPLLRGLTRAASVVLGLYIVIRMGDLAWRGQLRYLTEGSWAATLFTVELLMSAVIPLLLFTLPSMRKRPGLLATGALLSVGGFILHRADVGGIAHIPVTGQSYLPSLNEVIVSLGVVSTLALIFLFLLERFPVWEEQPAVAEQFSPPLQDPTTRTYFGRPWFGRVQMAALAWIVGVLAGLLLLEVGQAGSLEPEPRPVRTARTVWLDKAERANGPGTHFKMANPGEYQALLIDGDRAGTFVLFEHKAHQERLGGRESCDKCHHANLPLERGTSCATCHADMYRDTDVYSHAHHVRALGGNRSCVRCHEDPTAAKTREASKACVECHKAEIIPEERTLVRFENDLPPGIAPGYRAAMHGLCIRCHVDHETREAVEQPYLGRCAACHRGHSPDGEELRLREGWSLSARLELP